MFWRFSAVLVVLLALNFFTTLDVTAQTVSPTNSTCSLTNYILGNGTFHSPGYPNSYAQTTCWYIVPPQFHVWEKITFYNYTLDKNSHIYLYTYLQAADPVFIINSTSTQKVFNEIQKILFNVTANPPTDKAYNWIGYFQVATNN